MIEGLEIHGIITIKAPGVIIRNSKIVGGATAGTAGLINNVVSGHSFTVVDSELVAETPSPWWNGIMGSNFTAERLDIHGVVDPIRVMGNNVTVRSSWLHGNTYWASDPLRNGQPTHDDSIQIQAGSNILIEKNRMENAHNAAIQITQDTSRATLANIRILDNYLQGGACTVNLARTPSPINPEVSGNLFGPERQYSHCALIAPTSNAPVLSRNTWEATGRPMDTYTVLN